MVILEIQQSEIVYLTQDGDSVLVEDSAVKKTQISVIQNERHKNMDFK